MIQFKTTTLLSLTAFAYFALAPTSPAQLPSPSPDGGYPNFNTAEGDGALASFTTGGQNTAIGFNALNSNNTGEDNTAVGFEALELNTNGKQNTAIGFNALARNATIGDISGNFNTAVGEGALFENTTGYNNTATGNEALVANTTGDKNTATGYEALFTNDTGTENTANGFQALFSNSTGEHNTANGAEALFTNTTSGENTALGFGALFFNNGEANTAVGDHSMNQNTSGVGNTAVGQAALDANMTGNGNIALGEGAGQNLTTGDFNIDIGNDGVAAEANTIRIGAQGLQTGTFIAGISGAAVTGLAVKVNADGKLGTPPSSARFKDEIKPMDKASEAILALKPVTFRYKKDIDPERAPQFGLVAEEVQKVNPDLVDRDQQGKPYTVRYDAVNAMLLNEFLKAHHTMQEQGGTIVELKKQVAILAETVKEQAAQIQKVSAQLELNKAAPQTVLNNR